MTADHSSVSRDAELDDLQFLADQESITLEESAEQGAKEATRSDIMDTFKHIPVGCPEGFGRSGQRLRAHGR